MSAAYEEYQQMCNELASLRQQNALLTLQAQKYREFLESAPLGSGVCCCGGPMDHSQWGEGHTPVDSGEYAVAQLLSTPTDTSALREFGVHVALLSLDEITSGYGVVEEEVRAIVDRVLKGE